MQQKLRDSMNEFLKKENCRLMFIRPPKRHFGLSYTLIQFMEDFEGEQILYLTDTQSQAKSMHQDFEHHLSQSGKEFVHNKRKSVCGNKSYRFDFIDSPGLSGLPKNTFFICNLQFQKDHSFLDTVRTSPEKSIWIIRDDDTWQNVSKQVDVCFFTVLESKFMFDNNFDLVQNGCLFQFS